MVHDAPVKTPRAVNAKKKKCGKGCLEVVLSKSGSCSPEEDLWVDSVFPERHSLHTPVARMSRAELDVCWGSACRVVTLELTPVTVCHGVVPNSSFSG